MPSLARSVSKPLKVPTVRTVNSRRQNDFDSGTSVRHLTVESRTLLHSTAGFPIFHKKSINIEKANDYQKI